MGRQSVTRDVVALLGIAIFFSSPASSSKSGRSDDPVPGTEQRLTYADAIVTGSKGRSVPDLEPADFSISVGGVRGKVTSAEYVSSVAARTGDARRIIVILYDNCGSMIVGSGTGDLLEGLAARAIAQDDILAVLPSLEGSGATQTLSGDRRPPAAPRMEFGQFRMTMEACGGFGDLTIARGETKGKGAGLRSPSGQPLVDGDPSYHSMISILEGLAEAPGRKNLVVISNFSGVWNDLGAGSPQIRRLIDLANRAGVAIHVLDLTDANEVTRNRNTIPLAARQSRHLGAVKQLAESTGGRFFAIESRTTELRPSPTGLDAEIIPFLQTGLAKIVEDSAAYYRLGYAAGGPGAAGADAKLEVKVTSRAGLKVRSWGNSVPPPPAAAPTREERLQAALRSPFRGFEIGVRAFPIISAGEPEGKAGGRLSNLRAAISVDAGDLVFRDEPGGMKRATVDVIAAAYGRENRQAAITTDSCSLSVTEGGKPPVAERVLLCELNLGMLEPGPYMVRVAVADQAGGRVGSAYAFAAVTNFNIEAVGKIDAVGLSSLILEAPRRLPSSRVRLGTVVDASPPPSTPPPPRANFVDRVFAPGAAVEYRFEAYGFTPGRKTEERKTEIMLDLGGGRNKLVGGRPRPGWNEKVLGGFVPDETGPGRPVLVRGEFTIPPDAEPGAYWAHVCTRDTVSGRWSLCIGCGFTVSAP